MQRIPVEPLTDSAFAPFGDVIQTEGRPSYPINQGTTQRFHALARVQVHGTQACAGISLARGDAFSYPIHITMLERHPKGSQAWIPRAAVPTAKGGQAAPYFLVVVAPNGANDKPDESGLRAFLARPDQGVNYSQGTWHHPLLSFDQPGEFVVVDRIADDANCDECTLGQVYVIDGS